LAQRIDFSACNRAVNSQPACLGCVCQRDRGCTWATILIKRNTPLLSSTSRDGHLLHATPHLLTHISLPIVPDDRGRPRVTQQSLESSLMQVAMWILLD